MPFQIPAPENRSTVKTNKHKARVHNFIQAGETRKLDVEFGTWTNYPRRSNLMHIRIRHQRQTSGVTHQYLKRYLIRGDVASYAAAIVCIKRDSH